MHAGRTIAAPVTLIGNPFQSLPVQIDMASHPNLIVVWPIIAMTIKIRNMALYLIVVTITGTSYPAMCSICITQVEWTTDAQDGL